MRRCWDKPWVWPAYLVGVRRRLRCPTLLLVLCPDRTTARWAATPIDLDGTGTLLRPRVLGPDAVPVLTDPAAAVRTPELSVLSALAHVREDGPYAVLDALTTALDTVEVDQAVEYARLVAAALPGLARAYLEELMATDTYEYESEFTRRLEARGEARGQATMLLRILDRRGVEVPADAEERIRSCTDLARFETWADRAVTADTITDVLG